MFSYIRAFSVVFVFICLMVGSMSTPDIAVAQSDREARVSLGVGPAFATTIGSSSARGDQTYGTNIEMHVRVHPRVSIGMGGALYRPTALKYRPTALNRQGPNVLDANVEQRLTTGFAYSRLKISTMPRGAMYGRVGVAYQRITRAGDLLLSNDAPPYNTQSRAIQEVNHRFGPEIGVGVMVERNVRFYAEPTVAVLAGDLDDAFRFQLRAGVLIPVR